MAASRRVICCSVMSCTGRTRRCAGLHRELYRRGCARGRGGDDLEGRAQVNRWLLCAATDWSSRCGGSRVTPGALRIRSAAARRLAGAARPLAVMEPDPGVAPAAARHRGGRAHRAAGRLRPLAPARLGVRAPLLVSTSGTRSSSTPRLPPRRGPTTCARRRRRSTRCGGGRRPRSSICAPWRAPTICSAPSAAPQPAACSSCIGAGDRRRRQEAADLPPPPLPRSGNLALL